MHLRASAVIAISLCLDCAGIEHLSPPPQPREYAVYDAVLQAMFFDPTRHREFAQVRPGVVLQLVIAQRTSLDAPPVLAITTLGTDQARESLAPLPDGLFDQLLKDNKTSTDLENRFALRAQVTFLGEQEVERLDAETLSHGWEHFWVQHLQAQGLLILSRVTFDSSGNTALVYAANGLENLRAAGYVILVTKMQGHWQVARVAMVWIS